MLYQQIEVAIDWQDKLINGKQSNCLLYIYSDLLKNGLAYRFYKVSQGSLHHSSMVCTKLFQLESLSMLIMIYKNKTLFLYCKNTKEMSEQINLDLKMQKRARFHMLLEWEEKRSSESAKYRSILTNLISRILQKASISREANIAVIKFLKEKALNSVHYSEMLLSEISYLPDPQHSGRVNSLTSGLSAVSDYQKQLSSKFIELNEKIQ